MLGIMTAACSNDSDAVVEDVVSGGEETTRPMTNIEISVSLDGDATTRVAAEPNNANRGIKFTWSEYEQLGVYIQKTDKTILRAGYVSSTGSDGDIGSRTFKGSVMEKESGESYIYMHPDLGSQTDIDYTSQRGALNSTAHLSKYIPLIWREGQSTPENQGYVFHLTLTFNEDPGKISTITIRTMQQGTQDRIFPRTFNVANLASRINKSFSGKTSSMTLYQNDDYTDAISLIPANGSSFTATKHGDAWVIDAYIAAASVKNLDVFRTKYNVKIDAQNGIFYTDYRSFPGQDVTNADKGLGMLDNGKCYNMETTCSKTYANTIISSRYRVNSLLGMWNDFGKVYDPFGLVAYSGGSADINSADVPQQLKDNKTAIISRYNNNTSGSPTWLGDGGSSLNMLGRSDEKQDNVTFNNILITEPTEVYVTFISDFAWNRDLLGYYHYPTDNESSITSSDVKNTIIFPDFSKPEHEPFAKGLSGHNDGDNIGTPEQAPAKEFETVKLLYTDADGYSSTTFPAGTTIGFMMMINVKATTKTLMTWSQWRIFTNSAWNKENTTQHGASSNWPATGYLRSNFFCSGDVCDASGSRIPGLAIYGVKDRGDNYSNTAYSAMMFMVSTNNPAAMQTQNTAYFNLGSGNTVILKQ